MASGSAILVAMWLGAVGPAVQTWSGTAPSGSCVGYRVYIDVAGTGTYYCDNGTWATVSTGGGGGGAPTTAKYLVMAADATLTQEVVVPTCSAGQHLFSNGTAISCTADSASPGSPVNSVQYNSAGAFAGSSNLTFDGTTLAFGAGLGSVAMRTVAGAVWEVGGAGKANIGSGGTGSSIELNTTGGDWVNTPNGFNSTTSNTAFQSQQAGAKWKFSLAGTNDYFYADSANGYRITTPGAIAATGGFVGNASTATALFANGTNCTAGQTALGVDASGNSEGCYTLSLSQLGNPTGDKTFTYPSGAKTLWEFSGGTDYAFSIHGTGAFTGSGDLVHFHMQGTTVDANADVLHIEAEDADAVGLRIANNSGSPTTTQSITASGKADFGGTVTAPTFIGALTGNASTATALAATPTTCAAGQAARGVLASGNATGCFTPGGGGGGTVNVVEVDVDFSTGATVASTVVTGQTWVTSISVIVCSPTMFATTDREEGMEDAVLEGLTVATHTRVAGDGFTLTVAAREDTTGKFKIHCTGG